MKKPLLRVVTTLIVYLTLFALCSISNAQSVGEVIVDFGFEAGADTAGVPLDVTIDDWSTGPVQFYADDAIKHSGDYSGSIKGLTDSLEIDGVYNIPFQSMQTGASYKISLWLKTEMTEGAVYVYLAWMDVGFEAQAPSGSTDWTEYVAEFQYGSSSSEPYLNIECWGKGQMWVDDITLTKTGEVDLTLKNPGFEEPNDEGTGPAVWFGHIEGGWTAREENYQWDDEVAHTGNYSAKFQLFPQDSANFYIAWRQDYPYLDNSLYVMGCWVKIEQPSTAGNCTFQINMGWDNSNHASISPLADTGWVYVQDTILYPVVDNYWRNQMRYRFRGGGYDPDSLPTCWIDDVVIDYLGPVPGDPTNIVAAKEEGNKINITFEGDPNLQSPLYHILMQPTVYDPDKNQLLNGGFETPNTAGDGPEYWYPRFLDPSNGHSEFDPQMTVWPAEDTDPYEGEFCIKVQSDPVDGPLGACSGWRIWGYDTPLASRQMAYLHTVMTKYKDIIPRAGKIDNVWTEEEGDSIWASGVNFRETWGDDAWFDTIKDVEGHPAKYGYQDLVGTSEEWVEMKMPVSSYSGFGNTQFWGGVGIGNWPNMGASGEAWFDNAGMYPFEEVGTTSSTSFTIEDVPEGVEYIAVWAEDITSGLPSKYGSAAVLAKAVTGTGIDAQNNLPWQFALEQNYPNPFNPITSISYVLPKSETVKLTVYNVLGQKVAVLIDNVKKDAGAHMMKFNASKLATGLYFYKIEAGDNVLTKRMMLIK